VRGGDAGSDCWHQPQKRNKTERLQGVLESREKREMADEYVTTLAVAAAVAVDLKRDGVPLDLSRRKSSGMAERDSRGTVGGKD
jgi:hypothetical protein